MKRLTEFLKTGSGRIIAVVAVVVVIAVVALIAGGSVSTCPNQSGPVDKSVTGKMINEDPESYKCEVIELTGQVFNTEKKGSDNSWQIYTDPVNSENDVVVYYTGSSNIGNDDYVKFTGTVGDVLSGENAFGGGVDSPTIDASSIQKISRDEAVAPAQKTIKPNVSQTISGIKVTITKIEFAAKETRIYISVKNDSSASVSIYSFDTKVVQGNSQVKDKTIYDSNANDELPDDIVAHTTETGKMYFEKADSSKPLHITMQGLSDADYDELNYNLTVKP